MRPLSALPSSEARRLRGLLFDLDDTLLTHGRLTRAAYDALFDLHDAGLKLVDQQLREAEALAERVSPVS